MTEREILQRLKKLRESSGHINENTIEEKKRKDILKRKWITYFRENIEIYINCRMGFHCYGYQSFSYHLMNEAEQYIEVSTRGLGKSLKVIGFASARALLYPHSKIGVTAVGSSQANENYLTAFMQELVLHPYSWFLNWLYTHKMITSRETDKGYQVTFWNGSIIYFFPCINSSRGLHLDVLIGEEIRLIKKADWDSIAMPMLVKRQAGFRNQPKYYERTDLDEQTKVICITSNKYKTDWFNTMYKNTTIGYFKDVLTRNAVFSVDIFSAIKHGLKDIPWYLKQKKEMDELSFRMEILNETVGEVEGAFFTLAMLTKNQLLDEPFYPITNDEYVNGTYKKFRKKYISLNEIRLLFVDFAFAGGEKNDNTVIGCMSAYKKGENWVKHVDYIETLNGAEGDLAELHIRELYFDYKADYIVYDNLNGGTVHYNSLTRTFEHPIRKASD